MRSALQLRVRGSGTRMRTGNALAGCRKGRRGPYQPTSGKREGRRAQPCHCRCGFSVGQVLAVCVRRTPPSHCHLQRCRRPMLQEGKGGSLGENHKASRKGREGGRVSRAMTFHMCAPRVRDGLRIPTASQVNKKFVRKTLQSRQRLSKAVKCYQKLSNRCSHFVENPHSPPDVVTMRRNRNRPCLIALAPYRSARQGRASAASRASRKRWLRTSARRSGA